MTTRQAPATYGVEISWVLPTDLDPLDDIEAWVAPDNAGAPNTGAAAIYAIQNAMSEGPITGHQTPNDDVVRWYRARLTRRDKSPGAYTLWYGCKPVNLFSPADQDHDWFPFKDFEPPVLNGAGRALSGLAQDGDLDGNINGDTDVEGGSLYVPDTETTRVGSIASPSVLPKTLELPYAQFMASIDTGKWTTAAGYLESNVAGGGSTFRSTFVLPKGVTITKVELRGYRNAVTDTVQMFLYRIDNTGTATGLATVTHAGTGWQSANATLSETVGNDKYSLTLSLVTTTVSTDAKFVGATVYYDMPSYDKGI